MKKTLIGGFIALIGSIMMMAFSISATCMMETGWDMPPGKFLSAIAAANVSFGFWVSIMLIVLGGVILVFEFFKGE